MNYTTLFNQIIAYANRGGSIEFAAAIPYFIEMGQQKIWKELNTTGFQKTTQLKKFQVNNAAIEKPADWQETVSIIYGSENNFFICVFCNLQSVLVQIEKCFQKILIEHMKI